MKNYKELSLIILCAGEGKRIQRYIPNLPKSLIKIKSLGRSIVEYSLTQFLYAGIKKIYIIYGYKAKTFIKYFEELESKNKIENFQLNKSIFLISAERNHQKGPFHSFLGISDAHNFQINGNYSLLIPGDTIFENKLISSILEIVKVRMKLEHQEPLIFYREMDKNLIKIYKMRNCFLISVVKLLKYHGSKILKSIEKIDLRSENLEKPILQTIPIYFFPSRFLKEIKEFMNINLDDYSNLTEFINEVYLKKKQVYTHKINKSNNFFELDTIDDLHFIEEYYKEKRG